MPNSNVLIIGSGIAGLCLAIKLANSDSNLKITIITKSNASESNTKYAQGGMAVVTDLSQDSYQKHIDDTLISGCGICNPEIVKMVVHEGPDRLNELIAWGANFDSNQGKMSLGKEGGHSVNRIVHSRDLTGLEMELALLCQVEKTKNIQLLVNHFAVDLLKNEVGACIGTLVIDRMENRLIKFYSDYTILSAGGVGQVYCSTTNPTIATGDGLAMAIRAGAKVLDMEFIQFHPTALYNPEVKATFLISEAVRGEGAVLINGRGEQFMLGLHPKSDLAPRDIVARGIHQQMTESKADHVFLDCTCIDSGTFENHFPNILAQCLKIGLDPRVQPIPVIPAAHYACGGVATDKNGQTSIKNLYAIGECARTGLHGANRLASNSLLEALVFSHNAALDILSKPQVEKGSHSILEPSGGFNPNNHFQIPMDDIRNQLQSLMSSEAGIIRTTAGLHDAMEQLTVLRNKLDEKHDSVEFHELRNLVEVAKSIIQGSLARIINCGGFFNTDLAIDPLNSGSNQAPALADSRTN